MKKDKRKAVSVTDKFIFFMKKEFNKYYKIVII